MGDGANGEEEEKGEGGESNLLLVKARNFALASPPKPFQRPKMEVREHMPLLAIPHFCSPPFPVSLSEISCKCPWRIGIYMCARSLLPDAKAIIPRGPGALSLSLSAWQRARQGVNHPFFGNQMEPLFYNIFALPQIDV